MLRKRAIRYIMKRYFATVKRPMNLFASDKEFEDLEEDFLAVDDFIDKSKEFDNFSMLLNPKNLNDIDNFLRNLDQDLPR